MSFDRVNYIDLCNRFSVITVLWVLRFSILRTADWKWSRTWFLGSVFLCVNVTLRDKLYVLLEKKNKGRARTRPAACSLLGNYYFCNYPDIDWEVSKGTVSIHEIYIKKEAKTQFSYQQLVFLIVGDSMLFLLVFCYCYCNKLRMTTINQSKID